MITNSQWCSNHFDLNTEGQLFDSTNSTLKPKTKRIIRKIKQTNITKTDNILFGWKLICEFDLYYIIFQY